MTNRNLRHALSFVLVVLDFLPLTAYARPKSPATYRVGWVRLRASDLAKSRAFYKETLQLKEFPGKCFTPNAVCFWINATQKLELVPIASSTDPGGLDLVGFLVHDLKKTRSYLVARGLKSNEIVKTGEGRQYFEVRDFENHHIAFESAFEDVDYVFSPISSSLIHTGFIVHDREAEDHFYKDLLGFRLYWHGGMKDDQTDWVSLQVPDGTDWLEFMVNVSPNADKKELGVMNHIALGVPDIKVAREQLIKNGWKLGEEPQIGRDGKWQLNLYDPDDTRVEFMEFKPTQKPCCSEFTGPHPGPKQ